MDGIAGQLGERIVRTLHLLESKSVTSLSYSRRIIMTFTQPGLLYSPWSGDTAMGLQRLHCKFDAASYQSEDAKI